MGLQTGSQPISWMTYLAILSVCLIINLPGVAISPIEGKLMETLRSSELEIQLLTVLPNFIIIPFVLLAGKLSDYRYKLPLIWMALTIFLGCGVAFLLVNSMKGLIIVSCILGCADGILIPFAMGFMVNTFQGRFRTTHLGIKSAVSNAGVVVATFVIGFLIGKERWQLPFSIYLVAILPLALSYWLRYIPGFGKVPLVPSTRQRELSLQQECIRDIDSKKIWGLIGNNVWLSLVAFSIILFVPQLVEQNGWEAKISADITSLFFVFVLLAGCFLVPFVRTMKSWTLPFIGLFMFIGLGLIFFIPRIWAMYAGACFSGISFGFFQPLIYDKTGSAINNPAKNIFGLSLVLTALYLAIAIVPFVITGVARLFSVSDENRFAFLLSLCLNGTYILVAVLSRKGFTFGISPEYYSK